MNDPRWNVLTDPWIPLDDGAGRASYASFVDLMTGARDAADLVHPRDDCRFFARMLLSALTQALFPAANAKDLRARMKSPMLHEDVKRRVEEVRGDFDLVGVDEPWMQATASAEESPENETRSLLLDSAKHLLFRPAVAPDALCPACAVVVAYGIQAFAPSGGRGYSPGVRGSPPTTTLVVVPPSVRRSVWANTLHTQTVASVVYGAEPERPWMSDEQEKDGDTVGLVEGLFWKPRSFRLVPLGDGVCAACGRVARAFGAINFGPRQKRTGGLYRHPMSPCERRSKTVTELRFGNLDGDRPAWTSLADWVSASEGGASGAGAVLPAPVVAQWTEQLADRGEPTSLMLLDYGANKASIVHRFVELFPLSARLADRDVADAVRGCVKDAKDALDALRKACVRLRKPDKKCIRSEAERLHDVTASFWQKTEPAFWTAYEAFVGDDPNAGAKKQDDLQKAIRKIALDLFNAWTAPSLGDPSRIALIAAARAGLVQKLPRSERAGETPGEHAA